MNGLIQCMRRKPFVIAALFEHAPPPPPSGSGQDLRQAEGGELLWAEGGGEAGDPHQGGSGGGRESHRQGRQDGRSAGVRSYTRTPDWEEFGFPYAMIDLD